MNHMELKNKLKEINSLLEASRDKLMLIPAAEAVPIGVLEDSLYSIERAALQLGALLEQERPRPDELFGKTAIKRRDIKGFVEVTELGWVHISLNMLLPHCRFRTPDFLQSVISEMLNGCTKLSGRRPYFDKALLVIDEHCNIKNRQIYDQDNKGFKAIPNAIKGILVPDDDQFTLELALLSTIDDVPSCQIYVLPADEAGEFFSLRSGQYGEFFRLCTSGSLF